MNLPASLLCHKLESLACCYGFLYSRAGQSSASVSFIQWFGDLPDRELSLERKEEEEDLLLFGPNYIFYFFHTSTFTINLSSSFNQWTNGEEMTHLPILLHFFFPLMCVCMCVRAPLSLSLCHFTCAMTLGIHRRFSDTFVHVRR